MILSIAAGGAIGSVLRHYAGKGALLLFGAGFPYGTLFVNIAGSFLMGVLIAFFAHTANLSQEWRAFLTVGFLGGFTTFSTFSLDAVTLYQRGEMMASAMYIVLSLVLSLGGLLAGMFLFRGIAS